MKNVLVTSNFNKHCCYCSFSLQPGLKKTWSSYSPNGLLVVTIPIRVKSQALSKRLEEIFKFISKFFNIFHRFLNNKLSAHFAFRSIWYITWLFHVDLHTPIDVGNLLFLLKKVSLKVWNFVLYISKKHEVLLSKVVTDAACMTLDNIINT